MSLPAPISTGYVAQVDEAAPPREAPPVASNVTVNVSQFTAHEPTPQLMHVQESRYVQYGQWRDGICECCTRGGWPSFWMSTFVCFWPCLFGKVASRIRWSPGLPRSWGMSPFAQWALIMTVLVGLSLVSYSAHLSAVTKALNVHIGVLVRCDGKDDPYNPCEPTRAERHEIKEYSDEADAWQFVYYLMDGVIMVLLLILRLRTRSKYLIPSACEGGSMETRRLTFLGLCEDAWCACCCACCTLAQLSRHTYAADECAPCADPGPAESMQPQFPGQTHHVTQMHVMNPNSANNMYGHNSIPVATSVFPVPDAVPVVGQGMPVPTPQV